MNSRSFDPPLFFVLTLYPRLHEHRQLFTTIAILRDALHVLMEGVPSSIDPDEVEARLQYASRLLGCVNRGPRLARS